MRIHTISWRDLENINTEWKKPVINNHILYDSICMKYPEQATFQRQRGDQWWPRAGRKSKWEVGFRWAWGFFGVWCWCLVANSYPALLRSYGLRPSSLLYPWDFPGNHTGVGCHFLLQGSSWPRDQTHIPCIGRRILYHWASHLYRWSHSNLTKALWRKEYQLPYLPYIMAMMPWRAQAEMTVAIQGGHANGRGSRG